MGKYPMIRCPFCKDEISSGGAGRTAHMRKHVRQGDLLEKKEDTGLVWFTRSGDRVEFQDATSRRAADHQARMMESAIRQRIHAVKVDPAPEAQGRIEDGEVLVVCRSCGEENPAERLTTDKRLWSARCDCGGLTFYPHRRVREAGFEDAGTGLGVQERGAEAS